MTDLSVVIVNYNTRDLLRDCLQSLVQSKEIELEIIVVDNASNDGSVEMVQEEFPKLTLLTMMVNTWFCGGNNHGILQATAPFVLLLNPDTVVKPNTLSIMLDFIQKNQDYVGVTAQLRYPNGSIQQTCARIPSYAYLLLNYTPIGFLFRHKRKALNHYIEYGDWQRDTDTDVEVIPGSCTLMRREDIALDDKLLLYFPEQDLAQRHQRPMRFLASTQITHHEKAATRNWNATFIFYRDLMQYTQKHHGIASAGLLWLLSRPLLAGMWVKYRFNKN